VIINKILKLILLKFTFANSKIASNNGKANPRSNLGPNLSILVKYAEIRVNSKNRKLLNIKNRKKLEIRILFEKLLTATYIMNPKNMNIENK
jgi:hypothetical protein